MITRHLPHTLQFFDLELPDGSTQNFLVNSYLSFDENDRKFLYVFLKPETKPPSNNGSLDKSLKFNSIRKLAPSVAHEIRNPLSTLAIQKQIVENIISSFSMSEDQTEKVKKSLKVWDTELERVIKLIDQFFNLIRTEKSEPTYEDLNSLLREVYDLVKQYCYENAINLEIKLEKNIPFIYVNRDHFILVLLNLIITATEAMVARGTLIIRSDTRDKKGIIYINDTGRGLTDYQKENIFNTEHVGDIHQNTVNLSEARRIIQDMNGNLSCESNVGVGTTFIVELPTVSKF
jgi:signal transduction histidine kinase